MANQPTPMKLGSGTDALSRQIYRVLSARIIAFELKPFEALSEVGIASELGVSRTPTREALLRLSDIGLVEVLPQRGTFVTPLREPDLERSQFLREALELALLKRVFQLGRHKELAGRLELEIGIQETCARLGEMERFYESDENFHALISDAAGLAHIKSEIDRAKVHMDRFRRLMVNGVDDMNLVLEQHKAITKKIAVGNAAASGKALQVHLQRVLRLTDAAKAAFPQYFAFEGSLRRSSR